MATTKNPKATDKRVKQTSAEKAAKQAKKRRIQNLSRKTSIKTAIRKVLDSLQEKDAAKTAELMKDVQAKLARAKSKEVIHPNTAARKMRRLAQKVKKTILANP